MDEIHDYMKLTLLSRSLLLAYLKNDIVLRYIVYYERNNKLLYSKEALVN